jgi:Pvc16 N-terminal domain
MLAVALKFIRDTLNQHIKSPDLPENLVQIGNVALIDAYSNSASNNLTNKVIISLINVEEERTLKNAPQIAARQNSDGTTATKSSPIYINLYLVFGANNTDYGVSLEYLSKIISFFHTYKVFEGQAYQDLGEAGIEKMIFDLCTMRFEELNQVWGILGGKYVPSVIYKVRLFAIQQEIGQGVGLIRHIETQQN